MLLVTGGAGFIGSNFVLSTLGETGEAIVNLDKLTYAGNANNLCSLQGDARHLLVRGDIADRSLVRDLLSRHRPRAIVHFAAETHVDRSIHGPGEFIHTNVAGTFALLEEARSFWLQLAPGERQSFRFLNVSTDEVYGSLGEHDAPFTERSPYQPNSPYSASKAAADHLVRAFHRTYGLPAITTNCSNNYGPYQFPEKLIPFMLRNALAGKPLPVYGDGGQVRDWLHVLDHCSALRKVLAAGTPGETYNIGGRCEKSNLQVVRLLCTVLDALRPLANGTHAALIRFVADRPGHDRRYALDIAKIRDELGWSPATGFAEGLRSTLTWYLDHPDWVEAASSGSYLNWVEQNYASRGAA